MAKLTSQYVCMQCGNVQPRWAGQCGACGAWDSLVEEVVEAIPSGLKPASPAKANNIVGGLGIVGLNDTINEASRCATGIDEVDRVLGGGLVAGSAILIGGDPGIGKSTLLLQLAAKLCDTQQVLYVTGEESTPQVQLRARRLNLQQSNIQLASSTSVRDVVSAIKKMQAVSAIKKIQAPAVVVIDSIQTMYIDNIESAAGTVAQVRASSAELIRVCKKRGVTLILIGHVTKEGQIAGPRVLEHMVDTVLYFEGERNQFYRLLRATKNRFGAAGEVGVFTMGETGLSEVASPSALFLSHRSHAVSGAAIYAGLEGTRPVLLEMEALVAPNHYATPRRAVIGWEAGRLAMLLAVLEARAGINLADREVYLNVAGGYKVQDSSADMAAAAALISAKLDIALPLDTVYCGEIALSGDFRPTPQLNIRLKEAAKLGFKRAIIPHLENIISASENLPLPYVGIKDLNDLVKWISQI
jgi:DNA repair protein RadA/Sms